MTEQINKPGVFVPKVDTVFPNIPDIPLLVPKVVREVEIDENYPYLDKSFKAKLDRFLIYSGIFTLVFLLQKTRYGLKIVGKKNIRKNKNLLKNGAITVCNHVYRWDFLAVLQAIKYRTMYFPARAENLKTSDAFLIRGSGGIPIPLSIKASHKFGLAFDELHKKKKWIHVFSESCRWDFYQPIRPLKKGAFSWAYKYKIPVIPMAISFRDPKSSFIHRILKTSHPLITINVGEPICIDNNLDRKEAIEKLREQCHQKMCEMAGIIQNQWQAQGD